MDFQYFYSFPNMICVGGVTLLKNIFFQLSLFTVSSAMNANASRVGA